MSHRRETLITQAAAVLGAAALAVTMAATTPDPPPEQAEKPAATQSSLSADDLAQRHENASRSAPRQDLIRREALMARKVAATKAFDLNVSPGPAMTAKVKAPKPEPVVVEPDLVGNRALGRQIMAEFGFAADQWPALEELWTRESGWNHLADNPSSSAYGIPQALPGSKMASAGADWATNPATQIRWGLGYIAERYGNPDAALAHSDSIGWY